jgi:hypothetical protein
LVGAFHQEPDAIDFSLSNLVAWAARRLWTRLAVASMIGGVMATTVMVMTMMATRHSIRVRP